MKTITLSALGQSKKCECIKDVFTFIEGFKGFYLTALSENELISFFSGAKDKITEVHFAGRNYAALNTLKIQS